MLQKFISLKKIGRFVDCTASGDVEFRRLTLVFAGNGQGKTTLCSVLRSLQTGESSYLLERKTRGQSDEPSAEIRVNQGNARFGAGSWSATVPQLAIYDSEFIHENIYAGEYVDHEQKKRLYRVMVGQQGVALARKVDELDEQSREIAKEIRNKKATVQAFIPDGIQLIDFIALQEQDGIDDAIAAKAAEIEALQRAVEIKNKAELQKISLPCLPDGFESLLDKQLNDISADVEAQVQDHIAGHTKNASTTWLAQGVEFSTEEACPFCGRKTKDISIVKAYTAIFGEKYGRLKSEIGNLLASLDTTLGEAAQMKANKTQTNQGLQEFWSQFVSTEVPELDYDQDVHSIWNELYVTAKELAQKKAASPLQAIELPSEFIQVQSRFVDTKAKVDVYNGAIDVANALIKQQKAAAEAGNLLAETKTLQLLKATKARYQSNAVTSCEEYSAALTKKTQIESDKKTAKEGLDDYSLQIFGQYKRRINELLESFGADFRVGDLTPSYVGGHPSTSYPVIINEDQVDVGDIKTPRGTPSFRSTLSAGDRSSLALAFFMAHLEKLPSLADTIIVLDDPFTSQDRSRRTYTQQLICQKVQEAKQVVVTSHDPHFLKMIWDHYPTSADVRTVQLARTGGNGTTITEWDIEEETKSSYLREIATLKEFFAQGTGGDLRDVARKIRPVLEAHLRLRIPHQFQDYEWLGDFIRKIREADSTSPLQSWQGNPLNMLTNINDYSKKYHHEQNVTSADTEPIDDGELRAYVQQTLRFVGSC